MKDLRFDINAGFSVALIALPLSIGIALASGAPASAGLIAAIVGGLIGSWMGGCAVTINGPAAGLIVIVLDAVMEIGKGDLATGFRGMLAAAMLAGAMQIIAGLLKLGSKAKAFPSSVIHGMMAAIGLIIMAKQVHVLLGHVPIAKNPIMLYAEIPTAFMDFNGTVALIGLLAMVTLVALPKIPHPMAKKLPYALIAVTIASITANLIHMDTSKLLNVPTNMNQWIIFPDFSVLSTYAGIKAAISLMLVASLETVLSASAVDKLDPEKRQSNLDRDLMSKGVCNLLSASVGGLPMIAEIVRSSANVSYGAKTWRANFVHGLTILLAVLLIPFALNVIPLSALAAVLLVVGYRLGNPAHLLHAKKIGKDHLTGFVVTLFVTLGVDLLVGIFTGLFAQTLVSLFMGLKAKHLVKPQYRVDTEDRKTFIFQVSSAVNFSNFLPLRAKIAECAQPGITIVLNLSQSAYIDHSSMENIDELKRQLESQGTMFTIVTSESHRPVGEDHLSALLRAS